MQWWLNILPLEKDSSEREIKLTYQRSTHSLDTALYPNIHHQGDDKVMMIRNRLSRILHSGKFFRYPLTFSLDTLAKLGPGKLMKISFSYAKAKLRRPRQEITLEDFFINRFGRELYLTFFKDYTEKVWGKSCREISAEWGIQRIKELSIGKVIRHAIKDKFSLKKNDSISQQDTQTSLIERFLYPRLGPGQLWEEVAGKVGEKGCKIQFSQRITAIHHENDLVTSIELTNQATGKNEFCMADYFLSTMPVNELIRLFSPAVPPDVQKVAEGLQYRDFITVGILVRKLKITDQSVGNGLIKDNWIYIQEPEVKLGRLQIYNNWSPWMVNDSDTVWLGLEYFCQEGDSLWNKKDEDFIEFAASELQKIGIIDTTEMLDGTVIRTEKAYPAYFGTYGDFGVIKNYTDRFRNLYLLGRNGMHKYNNADHSMLTAMTAVDNIIGGITSKENIWKINTEEEYHEASGSL